MKSPLTLVLLLIFTAGLHGGVTYVDANLANTGIASGGSVTLWADGNDGTTGGKVSDGSVNKDGKWRFRSEFGNGGVWEATGSSAMTEDCAELVTSVAVANGHYKVYVFYYMVNESGDYPIRAGFVSAPNANRIFKRRNGQQTSRLDYDVAPPTGDETRTLLCALVGQIDVTNRTLKVFIDDFPASTSESSSDRTWYAGIGYEAATNSAGIAETGSSTKRGHYLSWIADPSFGLPPKSLGFSDDPDGDGLVNGLEAWLGTPPGESNKGLENRTTGLTNITFSHPQNANPPKGLTALYQWSPNRSDWYAGNGKDGLVGGPNIALNPTTVDGATLVTVTAGGEIEKIYVRVIVRQD